MASISQTFGSYNALANLRRADEGQARTQGRLSSGERLMRSQDAPDEFATSQQLRSEIKALRGLRSTSFESSGFIQIAEGALTETENMLHRAMELATAAASEALGPEGGPVRTSYQVEFQEILNSLNELNANTRANDKVIFGTAGTSVTVNLDIDGANSSNQITLTTTPVDATTLGLTGFDLSTTAGANGALANLRPALDNINAQRSELGVMQRRLERNIEFLSDKIESYTSNESQIRDANIADEVVNTTTYQILNQSNVAVLAQSRLSADAVFQLLA